jgi:hypothetical protein
MPYEIPSSKIKDSTRLKSQLHHSIRKGEANTETTAKILRKRITLPKALHTGTRTWKSVKEKLDEELVYTES